MASGSFAFTKWYIDCLDRDGRLIILYWASLKWRRLLLTWHSVTRCDPGARVWARSSVRACEPPVPSGASIRWASTPLKIAVAMTASGNSIAAQELADGVSWACPAPAARVTVQLGDTAFRGTGYAEVMQLRVPPWTLGIRRLRWGRWISDDTARSVVWIEWNGVADRRWVFRDGTSEAAAKLEERMVTAGPATVALGEAQVVVDRGLGGTLGRVPAVRAVAPRWLLGGHEVRRTRAGVLREGRAETRGTAVDEIVDFG